MNKIVTERQLSKLAKRFRERTGKSKADVAREFQVSKPTIQDVEETPTASLTKLRIRIIEKYSHFKVIGPVYLLRKK